MVEAGGKQDKCARAAFLSLSLSLPTEYDLFLPLFQNNFCSIELFGSFSIEIIIFCLSAAKKKISSEKAWKKTVTIWFPFDLNYVSSIGYLHVPFFLLLLFRYNSTFYFKSNLLVLWDFSWFSKRPNSIHLAVCYWV